MRNDVHLPTLYQQYIHQSRYARHVQKENRRETWTETVERYVNFMTGYITENHSKVTAKEKSELFDAILGLQVMPSMRSLMTAGPALARDHIAGFNCSFIAIDHPRAFDEMMYILMCGSGVGFSVERQHVSKLPEIPDQLYECDTVITVGDSKLGWAKATKQLIAMLYAGEIPKFDTSKVRPAGALLKTFGGRASGPKPLLDLFEFIIRMFQRAVGRKLNSLEAHDICCKIGDIVVVGGVRRSALISLSNLDDESLRGAKFVFKVDQYSLISEDEEKWTYSITMKRGQSTHPTYTVSFNKKDNVFGKDQLELKKLVGWWDIEGHRRLSNNSVAYTEKPEVGQWMDEWSSIYASKSGERGVFNRQAAIKQCERFGRAVITANGEVIPFGTNPCGEIILRSLQFCNLTEVVARIGDTRETLIEKVRLATILGTFQSCLTNYRYIRKKWKENSEEERLLGVSFTGIMDCPLINGVGTSRQERNELLATLREVARETNDKWSKRLGIERSAAITCVKPSGTVSQLVDASSGIHSRHSETYIRTARSDIKDPLTQFMLDKGFSGEADLMNADNMVFSFPITAPEGSICRNDRTAVEELENWLDFKEHWCHHNPSVTINVRENEWPVVGAWVWDNFDSVAGVSFLPNDDNIYRQAPYTDASVDEVNTLEASMPKEIDWTENFEGEDGTTGSQELACTGAGGCEI